MIEKLKPRVYSALKKSEKYTKTDMVYLARGGFWLTLGQVAMSLSALALAAAFANLVPPETYGAYKYILSIASIFAIFSLPGMETAISRSVAQGQDGFVHAASRTRVMYALIGSAFALIGSSYYFLNSNLELSLALLIIAATLPFFDTLTAYLSYFIGKRRFDMRAKYYVCTHVVSVISIVTVLTITDNLIFILLAYFLPLAIVRAILYWRTVGKIPRETDVAETKSSITYGKHLSAMRVLGIVASNADKFLLWHFLGPAQVAIYTFALAVPEQIKGPLKGIGTLAFPKFAAQTHEQIRANLPALYKKLALFALVLLILIVLYVLAAPFIFQILFSQYMESVVYTQIIAWSLLFSLNPILIKLLEAQKKTQLQYVLQTVRPVLLLTTFAFFIPLWGVMGAVIALVGSRLLFTLINLSVVFVAFKK